jgi:hypothetical protein
MAKKRSPILKFVAKKTESAISNPPFFQDMLYYVGPAVGSYAATRAVGAVTKLAGRKFPRLAPFLPLTGNIGAFVALWLYVHHSKNKKVNDMQTQVVVGSAIAVLQSIVKLLEPKIPLLAGILDMRTVSMDSVTTPTPASLAGRTRSTAHAAGNAAVGMELDPVDEGIDDGADTDLGADTLTGGLDGDSLDGDSLASSWGN